MNQITDPPNEYTFGLDFDYGVWQPDTSITFANVPWDNSYQDVWETSEASFNKWFDDLPDTYPSKIHHLTYATPSLPIKVNAPLNAISKFNYLRVHNPAQPVPGSDQPAYLYYFILDTFRTNANTTTIHVQIDVWQTYRRKTRFLRAFIEQGHAGIANESQNEDRGRKWLNIPEGLDTGAEYLIADYRNLYSQNSYDVLITSATNLVAAPGTISDPSLATATGGSIQNIPSATSTYMVTRENLRPYFSAMAGYPWVTQGIVRVVIVPRLATLGITATPVERTNNYPPGASGSAESYLHTLPSSSAHGTNVTFDIDGILDQMIEHVGPRYAHLKKFLTAPYCLLEVSTFMGDTMTYRPELFSQGDPEARVDISLIPGAERMEFSTRAYNALGRNGTGERYNAAVSISNFPTLPVVNNMAIGALASSAHSRNAARGALDFSQQLAMMGNQNAYDSSKLSADTAYQNEQANRGLSTQLQGMQQQTAMTNQGFSAAGNVIMGAGAGGAAAGPVGAGVGAIGAAASSAASAGAMLRNQQSERQQLAATNRVGQNNANNSYNASQSINESNKALADFGARGNYEQGIKAMQAKVQDTMLTQPGVSGGFGGEFLRLIQQGYRFECRLKAIDKSAVRRIGEHWLRYGYMINTFMHMPEDLHVMTKFTYWKAQEVYMYSGRMPEIFRMALKGILTKGVTVWKDVNDIGVVDPATNRPITGFSIGD